MAESEEAVQAAALRAIVYDQSCKKGLWGHRWRKMRDLHKQWKEWQTDKRYDVAQQGWAWERRGFDIVPPWTPVYAWDHSPCPLEPDPQRCSDLLLGSPFLGG